MSSVFMAGVVSPVPSARTRVRDPLSSSERSNTVRLHPLDSDITTLTSEELHYQLDLIEAAFRKILGVKPRFFRPAYGTYDTKSLRILQERGYSGKSSILGHGRGVIGCRARE